MRNFFIFFLVMALSYTANAEVNWFGGAQITAEGGPGVNGNGLTEMGAAQAAGTTSGLRFGTHMIRLGAKYTEGDRFAKVMLHADGAGTVDLKWAYVGRKFNLGFVKKVRVGLFKDPIGMEFNTMWNQQLWTKYSVLKPLQGGAFVGGQLSGDLGFGLSYDLAVGNGTTETQKGDALRYVAKINYDMNAFHFQVGYEIDDEKDSVDTNKDKKNIVDVGLSYKMDALTLTAEYVIVTEKTGDTETSKTVAYQAHAGYKFMQNMEAMVRYVSAKDDLNNQTLNNIWLGYNLYASANDIIKINYVVATGDKRYETNAVTASNGLYDANAFLAQWQMTF